MIKIIKFLKEANRKRKRLRKLRSKQNPWSATSEELANATKDFLAIHPELIPLHRRLTKINQQQLKNWDFKVYCDGSFYQGYEKIGIFGVKPTERRLSNYEIDKYLTDTSTVLDIGSNAGFMACEIATRANHVTAIEFNPYLNKIGRTVADYLSISNVEFLDEDFAQFTPDRKFDCVLSLSNHHTIDGNLDMDFQKYIEKIFIATKPGAALLFESHDIWGDDSDLGEKFEICSRYFILKRAKMVRAFYKPDIDKLFAVFERRPVEEPSARCEQFNLDLASKSHEFIEYNHS